MTKKPKMSSKPKISDKDSTPATVFIVQRPRPKEDGWSPNFESALNYGKLEFIFEVSDKVFSDPVAALEKARKKLANFDADRDYLLWANFGDPAAMWLVIQLLSTGGNKLLRYLYWSRGKSANGIGMSNANGFYFPVEINLRAQ